MASTEFLRNVCELSVKTWQKEVLTWPLDKVAPSKITADSSQFFRLTKENQVF